MEIKELDVVILERDEPKHGLKRGDMGTVVHLYEDGQATEVEFVSKQGETVAVLTLKVEDVSLVSSHTR